MRAAVLTGYGEPLSIRDVPEPTLDPHGVVVEVDACGICRSDWHAWKGHGEWADDRVPIGQILGHEPAGTVVDVGDRVESLSIGDSVAIPFSVGDGTCPHCRNGRGNICADGFAIGFEPEAQGAFAERVHLPYADYNAMRIPQGVSARDVAAIGCRYMTAFHALEHRASITAGDWVAVHGCGGVGLSAIQLAAALGARPIAVDVRESALDRARELGAVETVDAESVDVVSTIRSTTERESGLLEGADVSIDALGIAETCRNSVRCLRHGGTHVQLGLTTDVERGAVSLPTDWMTRWEIDFLGSRGMPPTRYGELFGMIEAGRIDPGALVTRTVSLDEVSDRLAAMDAYAIDGIEVVTEFH
ncbi:MAG: zinc-dependent alcohol dehydrogenase family protein [Halobacteriota archaeon]